MRNNVSSYVDAFDWSSVISMTVNIAIVTIAVASLYVAVFAIRHQREHDKKMLEHDRRMSEPYVTWSFGGHDTGAVTIGLWNGGPGAARFVRSTLLLNGNEITDWNWLMVNDAVGQGDTINCESLQITMPKFIRSGERVDMITISIESLMSTEILLRLITSVEIRYFYRSNISDKEIVTKWTTPAEVGLIEQAIPTHPDPD